MQYNQSYLNTVQLLSVFYQMRSNVPAKRKFVLLFELP